MIFFFKTAISPVLCWRCSLILTWNKPLGNPAIQKTFYWFYAFLTRFCEKYPEQVNVYWTCNVFYAFFYFIFFYNFSLPFHLSESYQNWVICAREDQTFQRERGAFSKDQYNKGKNLENYDKPLSGKRLHV